MNIPPKCEDLHLKIAELERREAALQAPLDAVTFNLDKTDKVVLALRKELETSRTAFKEELNGVKYTSRKFRQERDALQQRLTVAEQRASELEGLLHMSKELLTTISRHGVNTKPNDWCDSFKAEVAGRIEKIDAALKPA